MRGCFLPRGRMKLPVDLNSVVRPTVAGAAPELVDCIRTNTLHRTSRFTRDQSNIERPLGTQNVANLSGVVCLRPCRVSDTDTLFQDYPSRLMQPERVMQMQPASQIKRLFC